MVAELAKWTVIIFGVFIIFIGLVMLFWPTKAREILRKAGSTNLINYTEITIRLIPAITLVICADYSKYPPAFLIFGWFMIATSLVLYLVTRRVLRSFPMKSADLLKPLYFQIISPFAFLFGGLIICNVIF